MSKNKYGTVENIKVENETKENNGDKSCNLSQMKSSSSWPYNTFLNFMSKKKTKFNNTAYSFKELDQRDSLNRIPNSSRRVLTEKEHIDEELIRKVMPLKLNYSIKYENCILKLDIVSISLDNKLKVVLNPYVRIELINTKLKSKHCVSVSSENEVDSNKTLSVDDQGQFKVCKTRVIRNELQPVYNETFVFNDIKNLEDYNIILSVYSTNKFSRDLFIGQLKHEFKVDETETSFTKELVHENFEFVS